MKSTLLISAFFAFAGSLHAIQDTNGNGLSDVWERHYNNGNLLPSASPYLAEDDPDSDGWSNADEAVAGTNPLSASLPLGWVRTSITSHPEAEGLCLVSWPSIQGKSYQLSMSTDLASWTDIPDLIAGTGSDIQLALSCEHGDGSMPERMFWRVRIADNDPDGDMLTSWEELTLGLDPNHPDSDLDGIFDGADSAPLSSATLADPDGLGLPASLENGLIGRWDYEQALTPGGTQSIQDLAGGDDPLTCSLGSLSTEPRGMISKGVSLDSTGDHLQGPASLVAGRPSFSISTWFQVDEDLIQNRVINTVLLAYNAQLDVFPEFQVHLARAVTSHDTQKLIFSHYHNGQVQPDWVIPLPQGFRFDDGEWRHFALVKSGSQLEILLDGQSLGTLTTTATWTAQTGAYFCLGKLLPVAHDPGHGLKGAFDRTRFYNRALSASEVTALHRQDTDLDGLWDITEARTALWRDSNSDGQPSENEFHFVASPFEWQFPGTDSDGDDADDEVEQAAGTLIGRADTDGDLLPDGWEIVHGLDPLVSNATDTNGNGQFEDSEYTNSDTDALTDIEEYRYNTNPNLSNSDGGVPGFPDNSDDATEVAQASNPNDPTDGGLAPQTEQMQPILLGIGDESGSKSEDYILNCYQLDPESGIETRVFTLRSGGYGKYKEETISNVFRKGRTYTFQIDWQGSSLATGTTGGGSSPEGPDFDYTFKVEPQDNNFGFLVESWDSESHALDTTRAILAEDASDVSGDPEDFSLNYERQRVVLLPMATYSADRMFAASIHLPLGFEGLSFQIENPVTGHDFGTHHHLMGVPAGAGVEGPAAAQVYNSIHGMLGSEDADGYAVQETRVWFMRSGDLNKPGRIEMYLVSPDHPVHGYGKIKITPKDDQTELGAVERELTPDQEMADAIEVAKRVASGEGFDFCTDEHWQLPGFGQGLTVPEEWATPLLIPFLSAAYQIEGMTLVGTGIIEGVVNGFLDDCQLAELIVNTGVVATGWAHLVAIAELERWRDDPRARLQELKDATVQFFEDCICEPVSDYVENATTLDGFREILWDSLYFFPPTTGFRLGEELRTEHGQAFTQNIWESLGEWFEDFGNRMAAGARNNAWINLPLDTAVLEAGGTQLAREQAYTFGYTLGYLCEQVAIGAVTVGVGKIAQIAKVGGPVLVGQLASKTAAAIAGRTTILKKWFASVAISVELRLAIEQGFTVASRTPLSAAGNRVVMEVIEDGLARQGFDGAVFNWKVYLDELIEQPNIVKLMKNPAHHERVHTVFARYFHLMGTEASATSSKGLARLYNRLLKFDGDNLLEDRFDDMLALMKTDTPQGRIAFRKSLEDYEAASALDPDAKFWFRDVDQVHGTLYKYSSFEPSSGWGSYTGEIPQPTWCSPKLLSSSAEANDWFLLPKQSKDPRYRFEFSSGQAKERTRVPRGDGDASTIHEPLTRDKPEVPNEWTSSGTGFEGGGEQVFIEGSVSVDRVIDLSTGLQVWP